MTRLILLALWCVSLTAIAQTVPNDPAAPQVVAGPFDWRQDLGLIGRVPGTGIGGGYPQDVLPLTIFNNGPTLYTLRTLGPAIVAQITSKHYAIIGHLKYSGVALGSFLEMENWFAPEKAGDPEGFYFSRTLGEAGPMAKIEGSDDGRDFALPFDATGAKTPLDRLVLKLHLMGPGELEISNVRLVQYPDAPTTHEYSTVKVQEASCQLGWPENAFPIVPPKMEVTPEGSSLGLVYWGEKPATLKLDEEGPAFLSTISSGRYAVEGKYWSEKVSPGSFFEMLSYFAPAHVGGHETVYFSRTPLKSGPDGAAYSPNPNWQTFVLPFDATAAKTHLVRVVTNLHLAGGYGTRLGFIEVYLKEYSLGHSFPVEPGVTVPSLQPSFETVAPEEPAPEALSSHKTQIERRVDWTSFFLGIVTAALALCILNGSAILFRRLRRQHNERELRRIASLDG